MGRRGASDAGDRPHLEPVWNSSRPPTTHPTRRLAGVAVLSAVGVLVAVALAGDARDSTHGVLRDPISYFGSPGAPHPLAFNLAAGATGVAIMVWSALGVRRGRRVSAVLLTAIGLSTVLLALWPIDCSPVDGSCELAVRLRATSTSHRIHARVGLVLFIGLPLVALESAWHGLRTGASTMRVGAAVLSVAIGSTAAVLVLLRPFEPGSGAAELAAIAAAAAGLWLRPPAGTVSAPTTRAADPSASPLVACRGSDDGVSA